MTIQGLDHVAITVIDVATSCAFYERVLDAQVLYLTEFLAGDIPIAMLSLGGCRLSVHQADRPASPHATRPTPGSADLCFRWSDSIETAISTLDEHEIAIELGPVPRPCQDGSSGQSVYFRDPDNNLIELLTTR